MAHKKGGCGCGNMPKKRAPKKKTNGGKLLRGRRRG